MKREGGDEDEPAVEHLIMMIDNRTMLLDNLADKCNVDETAESSGTSRSWSRSMDEY